MLHFGPDARKALEEANRLLLDKKGTASAVAMVQTGRSVTVSWVGGFGPTRAMLPHSIIEDFIRVRRLSAGEAEMVRLEAPHRNVVVRALGTKSEVTVDQAQLELGPGDRVVLLDLDALSTLSLLDVADVLKRHRTAEEAAAALTALTQAKDPEAKPLACVGAPSRPGAADPELRDPF